MLSGVEFDAVKVWPDITRPKLVFSANQVQRFLSKSKYGNDGLGSGGAPLAYGSVQQAWSEMTLRRQVLWVSKA